MLVYSLFAVRRMRCRTAWRLSRDPLKTPWQPDPLVRYHRSEALASGAPCRHLSPGQALAWSGAIALEHGTPPRAWPGYGWDPSLRGQVRLGFSPPFCTSAFASLWASQNPGSLGTRTEPTKGRPRWLLMVSLFLLPA